MHDLALAETYCSFAPPQEEWLARREVFTGLGLKLYNGPNLDRLPEKFRAFERELERCYCSAAYIACIALAASIVEVFYKSLGKPERVTLKVSLEYVEEELEWLRRRRNDLLHFGRARNEISRREYTENRSCLENDARVASGLVYHVARAYVRL